MKPAVFQVEVKRYIICPHCDKSSGSSADHLLGATKKMKASYRFGPWTCNECNEGYRGEISPDGSVSVEPVQGRKVPSTLELLRFKPQTEPLYLVVGGFYFGQEEEEMRSGKHYHYEEGTCTENYLRDVKMVILGSDTDPHGLCEYLDTIVLDMPRREVENLDSNQILDLIQSRLHKAGIKLLEE